MDTETQNPQQGDDDERGEDALDTGQPPGTHPNSEDPDPEVVEKARQEIHERSGTGEPVREAEDG